MELIAVVIVAVVFGLITQSIAKGKGYSGGFWWGFFLGVIGILVVVFRGNKTA